MPTVTGTLTDFGLQPLANLQPQIVFTPSSPATKNGRLLATRPVAATPAASGFFTVDLVSTEGTTPRTWYDVAIRWLNPTGGYEEVDFVEWRLSVPAAGGQIGTLIEAPSNPAVFWIAATEPPNPTPETVWIKNDENPARVKRYRDS